MSSEEQYNINKILTLVELAEDKSPTQRKFLYQKIGQFLIDDHENFSLAEKELMADILCRITSDVEKSIRAHFSKNISKKDDIPPELVVFLANDDIEVALPILQDCGLLEETDIIGVIRTRSSQHQLAIAARENISAAVTEALCDTENEGVCLQMLNNLSAQIPEWILERLGDQSELITAYQKPLLQRPFLPKHVAEKMYRWISVALREYISDKFDVDPRILEVAYEERQATIHSISKENDPSAKLVNKLHIAGELSNGFLLKSLRQGEIDLFELTFSKLLNLSRGQIQEIVYAKDPQLLAVACRVIGLDRVVFSTILDITADANISNHKLSDEDRSDVVGFYGLLKLEAAQRAIKNPQFLKGEIKYFQTN